MLRIAALALLLANVLYFAWGQGLLAAYGLAPARQTEPERLTQQIRPETLQVSLPGRAPAAVQAETSALVPVAPVAPVAPAPAAPASRASCLEVGTFTERQARALRPRLKATLPDGTWTFESSGESVRWIIYMGKYVSKAAMNRKQEVLGQMGLSYEPPASPVLAPGLSLGSFASRTEAEEALAQMNQRGLRSARVVLEHPELPSLWLRLPQANAAQRAQLEALKPQLAGKAVQACR